MVIWGIWLGMNLVLNSTWGKNNSFVQELISYSSIVSKSTLNTCTSNSFPMVAYISKSWVSLMVHIKVIWILVSRGILFFFDMHVSKYKVGTGIGNGKVWDVQLGFGEQSCMLGEWTTSTWSPILACTTTLLGTKHYCGMGTKQDL